MSNYRSEIVSSITPNGRIEIFEVHTCAETGYKHRTIRHVTDTNDPRIRQGLIDLRWTPPAGTNKPMGDV